ncbi:hypothetical protein HanLR1_Chr05g0174161 [Helianthus annuus]|nr:hypothetical protein HanLR1_Chr05g0174161 [Helianthus annuus]
MLITLDKKIPEHMATKSLNSGTLIPIFIFIIVLLHPIYPQSEATVLNSHRTIFSS